MARQARGRPIRPGSVDAVGSPDGERGTSWASGERAGDLPDRIPALVPPEPVPVGPLPPEAAAIVAQPRRTHRWGLGAYVVVEAVFIGVSLLIGVALLRERVSVGTLTVALTLPTVLAAGTAVLITRLRGNGPRADLGLVWSWQDIRSGIAYGFGGLAVTIPASLLYAVIIGPDRASSAIGDVFAGLRAGPVAALAVVLVVVLLAPLCEEIVYRGLLWGALERYALPRWVPFVVTTLLFAIAHFELTRTPLLFVVALPIALARLRTGRLAASVVAHQVNNLLPGVVLALTLLGVVPTAV
jgi:membrane protease YdiL (CAAX protease family)